MFSKPGVFSYSRRIWIIIFVLPLFSFFTLYRMIRQTPFVPQMLDSHPITQLMKENSELRDSVNAQNRIGYIEKELKENVISDATARYYLFQYILAPTVVVHSTKPQYIISYQGDEAAKQLLKAKKATKIRTFKNGVILLKRITNA